MSLDEQLIDRPIQQNDAVYQGNHFSVKNGYCHVLSDRLVITPSEELSAVERDLDAENGKRIWILAVSLGAAILCGIGVFYVGNMTPRARTGFLPPEIVFAFAGLASLVSFVFNFRTSFVPVVLRDQIVKVTYYNGFGAGQPNMFKRSRIAVHYKDAQGRLWKRTIIMPNRFQNGRVEMRKALTILRREGLLKN